MKNLVRTIAFLVVLIAATAFAGIAPVTVTVSSSGKTAFKGRTDAKGAFATGKLNPGNYVVQFNSSDASLKGKRFTLVVAAGKKKVSANAVAGEKFAAGGVAMKVDVGAGLNITGQVAAEDKSSAPLGKNGKPMVWIPKMIGSNLAAHWAEAGSAEAVAAKTAGTVSADEIRRRQDKSINPGE